MPIAHLAPFSPAPAMRGTDDMALATNQSAAAEAFNLVQPWSLPKETKLPQRLMEQQQVQFRRSQAQSEEIRRMAKRLAHLVAPSFKEQMAAGLGSASSASASEPPGVANGTSLAANATLVPTLGNFTLPPLPNATVSPDGMDGHQNMTTSVPTGAATATPGTVSQDLPVIYAKLQQDAENYYNFVTDKGTASFGTNCFSAVPVLGLPAVLGAIIVNGMLTTHPTYSYDYGSFKPDGSDLSNAIVQLKSDLDSYSNNVISKSMYAIGLNVATIPATCLYVVPAIGTGIGACMFAGQAMNG